jgi:hypothetical protein
MKQNVVSLPRKVIGSVAIKKGKFHDKQTCVYMDAKEEMIFICLLAICIAPWTDI